MNRLPTLATIATLCTALAHTAFAADMAIPPRTAPPVPAAFDWTGVYLGGQIGGGWSTIDYSDQSATTILNTVVLPNSYGPTGPGTNPNSKSFLGGAQIGWMYQIGRLVVGADFDWSKTALKGNGSVSYTGIAPLSASDTYNVTTDWTATATATVGLARDRWLTYAKGGVAWARNSYGTSLNAPIGFLFPIAIPATSTVTSTGWTVGAGLKWAFLDNWFVNLEYDFLDFGSRTPNLAGACPIACTTVVPVLFNPNINQTISEFKVELNYKFDSGSVFW